mgnify:CR=1 FL=1
MISIHSKEHQSEQVEIAIFIKSYAPDFKNLFRLLKSIEQFNQDLIPIYVCVPDADITQAMSFDLGAEVSLVPESFFEADFPTSKIHGRSLGYLKQQIIKLAVYQLGVARHYIMLDSDAIIIKPFSKPDFINQFGIGYTVLVEDLDQFASPWYRGYADRRRRDIANIASRVGFSGTHLRTCHGNVTFSTTVLESFEKWRNDQGLTPSDLMEIGPYEFSWYNFFVQTHHPNLVDPIEPFIRYVHVKNEFRSWRYQGITIEDLQRSYLGVCLNSNWTRGRDSYYLARLRTKSLGFQLRKLRDFLERIPRGIAHRLFK